MPSVTSTKLTDREKNALSAGLLVFATATEMLMQAWLRSENKMLQGENKMLFNGMTRGVQQARYYYERFTDKIVTVLYEEDENSNRIDRLREDASDMVRLYLTSLNCSYNGFDTQAIIDGMNRLLEKIEDPKVIVGEAAIDNFKIK